MTQRDLVSSFIVTLFRRKLTLVLSFVLFAGCVGMYTYLEYPLYRATDLILVRTNPKQQLSLFRDLSGPAMPNFQATPANDLIEVARSTGVAREIVRRFGLEERVRRRAEDPEGFREVTWYWIGKVLNSPIRFLEIVGIFEESIPNYEWDAIEQLVENRLEVYRLHDTELMKLSMWEEEPEMSAAMANAISALVIDRTNALAQLQATAAFKFIDEQVAVQGAALERLEAAVAEEKSSQNLIDVSQQQRLLLDRLDQLNRELDKVLQAEIGIQAGLAELESQLRSASSKNLAMLIEGQLVTLKKEGASWGAQKGILSERVEELQSELLSLPVKQAALGQMERGLDAQEKLYVGLNTKLAEFDIQQLYRLSEFDIRIVDAAYLPQNVGASWPEWDWNLMIGLPAALALALLLVLLLEYLDETYVTETSLEQDLAAPVLGSVPKVSGGYLGRWLAVGAAGG